MAKDLCYNYLHDAIKKIPTKIEGFKRHQWRFSMAEF